MRGFKGSRPARILAALALAVGWQAAKAQTYWLENPAMPDDWFDATAWTSGIPNGQQAAYVSNGGTATITYGTANAQNVYVGSNTGGSNGSEGTLLLSAGQLSSGATIYVGYSNGYNGTEGLLNQTGGAVIAKNLFVADNVISNGTYELSDNAQPDISGSEIIGYASQSNPGLGQFIQTGGSNAADQLAISNGSYSMSGGGVLEVSSFSLGAQYGAATFSQSGGTVTVTSGAGSFYVGYQGTSSYSITNGGTLNVAAAAAYIGDFGAAIFTQSDSTCNFFGANLYIGQGESTTYTLAGSSQLYANNEYIGGNSGGVGTASFIQTGGINSLGGTGSLYLGQSNSTANYSLQSGATLMAGNEYIGCESMAVFTQTGGENIVAGFEAGSINLGTNPNNLGGNGEYFLSGGSLTSTTMNVGISTTNAGFLFLVDQTGGTDVTGTLTLYATGRYDLISGVLNITKAFVNTGTFDLQNPALAGSAADNILKLGSMPITNTIIGSTGTGTGSFIVEQNAALYAGSLTQGSLIIGGKIEIAPQSATSKINSLDITGGTLDITNNELIVDYPTSGPTPLPSIRAYLLSGYANNWTGTGIISSTAAGDLAVGIGYAENADLKLTTFGGTYVDSTAVLIRYTWIGDANIDGIVNATDLAMMQSNGTTWDTGDFNYDGVVNADDYALFDLGAAASGGSSVPVPESTSWVIFAIPLILGGIRRRASIAAGMV